MFVHIYEVLESIFHLIVEYGILFFEFVGVCILVATAIRSMLSALKKEPGIRLKLAEGIALALEFKLGSEVLRTVLVREWSELVVRGAVIALRGALTFLIHWEIKNEEAKLPENGKEHENK